MKDSSITIGQLDALLTGMGFQRMVLDEHRVGYRHKPSGSLFVLPNRSHETPARPKDVNHVRFQLHWRGLMDESDFDTHFANLAAITS